MRSKVQYTAAMVIICALAAAGGISMPAARVSAMETGRNAADAPEFADGVYSAEVELTGGSGKAWIESPCEVTIRDGKATADILWSSSHYDYMMVDGETYYPLNTEGNSRFEIPVTPGEEMVVQADTTAMSQPHLIEYTLLFTLTGAEEEEGVDLVEEASASQKIPAPPEIGGLTYVSEMDNFYAEEFAVYYYEEDFKVLAVSSGREYLVVPEGGAVPEELPENMTVILAPADRIYLAASSAMALFHAMDALDAIAFSGTEADGWYIEAAAEAMQSGDILFAGKYSQPDYEGLLAGGCDLAVESTMILHTPEVQEKLEALGIPVLIDESSHESHPLGRSEWIRFYGALLDKEDEADAFFAAQAAILEEMEASEAMDAIKETDDPDAMKAIEGTEDPEETSQTVAFFFVNSAGNVVVRRSDDYIAKMIALAGGTYAFADLENPNPESTSGSVTLSMEEFYARAKDCDYLIYNAAIDSPLTGVDDLLGKGQIFADFKAVQEGHVYTTDKYMYQATDILGELIRDMHGMLTGADPSTMLFLKPVA